MVIRLVLLNWIEAMDFTKVYWEFCVDGADEEEVLEGGMGKPEEVGGPFERELLGPERYK